MSTKIQIDLEDILGDEFGGECLADSIRRQVIDSLTESARKGIQDKIDEEVNKVLSEELRVAVKAQMPGLIADLLQAQYTPVQRYGEKGKPTTLRNELIKCMSHQMVYKRQQYKHDQNHFTNAIDSVVGENVEEFKGLFIKTVDQAFLKECMNYAIEKMQKTWLPS